FAKAAGIKYLSREGQQEFAWTTSWGVSTRLIGTMIMAHSDDDGLVLPPRVAPTQVVIVPVIPKDEVREKVLKVCDEVAARISQENCFDRKISVEIDRRDENAGVKNWEWIKKGIPVRIE